MSKPKIFSYIGIAFVVVFFVFLFIYGSSSNLLSSSQIEVRWLIAHEPIELWENATKKFDEVLTQESDGRMKLKILDPSDVGFLGDVPTSDIFKLLNNGEIELSTMFAVGIGTRVPDYLEVNLPFLFDNFEDAFTILNEGPAGKKLLDAVSEYTNTYGLAFTLSGGFRVIVSQNLKIKTVDDLKGKKIISTAGPVGDQTLRQLGAIPLPSPQTINDVPSINEVDGVETTYTRISAIKDTEFIKYISEINHNLFLTSVLVHGSFYESLSPQDRESLHKAVTAAAKVEWDDSIALGNKVKKELKEKGVFITELSSQEKENFKKETKSVYDWFQETYGSRVIQ